MDVFKTLQVYKILSKKAEKYAAKYICICWVQVILTLPVQTYIWTSRTAVAANNFIKWVLFHCKIMTDNNSYYRWPGEVVKIFLNKATNQRWVLKLQFLILDQASHVAWSWTLYRGREDEDDIMLRRLVEGLTAPARNEKQKNQLFLMYASMLSGTNYLKVGD